MTFGGFGGESSRDLILVQSMDGRITIFEQETHAFTRRLNNVLVPGPIIYVPKIDSFVTATSTLHVECYKYQVLASSNPDGSERGGAPEPDANQRRMSVTAKKKVTTDWSICVGEQVRPGRREAQNKRTVAKG